jgi:sugar phosphate isomerase/epimerase
MKICSTTSKLISWFGEERAIEILADAGFDCVDVGMFFAPDKESILHKTDDEVKAYYTGLREMIEKKGMYVRQTHTPFPVIANDEYNDVRFEMQRKGLMASGILGAYCTVVHPTAFYPTEEGYAVRLYNRHAEENYALNLDMYSRLLPYLEEYNMIAAIENMFGRDPVKNVICPNICSDPYELARLVDDCNAMCKNGKKFVVCLDIGHTNLSCRGMAAREIVNVLGDRLHSLHLHDNNGITDEHTAPGFGTIDWADFFAGLHDIGYDGDFIYEADNFYTRFDLPVVPDAAAMLYKIARNLVDKYGFN